MSPVGQNRKSATLTKMSEVGGKADVDKAVLSPIEHEARLALRIDIKSVTSDGLCHKLECASGADPVKLTG